ncbi:hypothetical protein [Lishizhenia sp.]|uniref:hypothetical protein n=1 Tax=Lishizhenia sp. TaxID=2497594 RepID=UPI00299D6506|nr:hypothetical protein [Lishizhenia sp.]MDX1447221.1 hypothetical protein [Lishizhenia sp.]
MQSNFPKKKTIDGKDYEKFFTGSHKQVEEYIEQYNVADNYYFRTEKDGHKKHLYLRRKLK